MKKPYYLYTRTRKDGKKVFYVKFRGPDGEHLLGKSTGETSESAAEAWVIEQITDWKVRVRTDIRFDVYARDFFASDGPYVKHLRNRGRKMGETHARHSNGILTPCLPGRQRWQSRFGALSRMRRHVYGSSGTPGRSPAGSLGGEMV